MQKNHLRKFDAMKDQSISVVLCTLLIFYSMWSTSDKYVFDTIIIFLYANLIQIGKNLFLMTSCWRIFLNILMNQSKTSIYNTFHAIFNTDYDKIICRLSKNLLSNCMHHYRERRYSFRIA